MNPAEATSVVTPTQPNPYKPPVTKSSWQPTKVRVKRGRILIEHLVLSVLASLSSTVVATLVWDSSERLAGSREKFQWSPIDDLDGMFMLAPLGWAIYSFLHFSGWIFWLGLLAAVISRQRWLLLLALLAGIAFGIYWPKQFVMMMGV